MYEYEMAAFSGDDQFDIAKKAPEKMNEMSHNGWDAMKVEYGVVQDAAGPYSRFWCLITFRRPLPGPEGVQ